MSAHPYATGDATTPTTTDSTRPRAAARDAWTDAPLTFCPDDTVPLPNLISPDNRVWLSSALDATRE